MPASPAGPDDAVEQLRDIGLSDNLLDELKHDKVDLARVAALLKYGQAAAQLDTPAARRRERAEAQVVLRQLKQALARAQGWYKGHVDYLDGGAAPTERQRRPVYWAVGALRALLDEGAAQDDPLVFAAAQPPLPPSRGGRPDRPWLQEIRQGLAEEGCSEDQITDLVIAAGFHPSKT
jgi:alkanesulfonate monooxygenase SsuD/methylene tetrahydromethanopterin reductase-like flavin-dependent oxidoreductase (luciferase family)